MHSVYKEKREFRVQIDQELHEAQEGKHVILINTISNLICRIGGPKGHNTHNCSIANLWLQPQKRKACHRNRL